MDKKEYSEFIKEFITYGEISPGCKSLLKYILKKIKNIDSNDINEFIEIHNLAFERYSDKNVYPQGYNADGEDELQAFFDTLIQGTVRNTNTASSGSTQPENNSNIKWIKRKPMVMLITEDSISINKSLSEYLMDIADFSSGPIEFIPFNKISGDDNEEDDEEIENVIECVIGQEENDSNLYIGMTQGVTDLHTFTFHEYKPGLFKLDKEDVHMFNVNTQNKYNGYYLFEYDEKKANNCLTGRKILPCEINE